MSPPARPLRILHHMNDFRLESGGVTRAVSDLCTGLAARGHIVTMAVEDDTDVPAEWRTADAPVRAVRLDRPDRAQAERLVREADAVHLHGMWTTTNVPFARAARSLGVPYAFSPHGMLDDWAMSVRRLKKRAFLALVGRRMLHGAAFVHCAAGAELEQSRKWFPRGRGVVIPLILDLSPYRALPGPGAARARFEAFAPGDPVVLFVGRLHPIKGVDTLLRAAASLKRRGMRLSVVIAGSGEAAYTESLRRLAGELGLEGSARFVGPVFGTDKVSLYEAADVVVLASGHENFGFVTFESLAAGTPVVTTRAVGTWPELEASGGSVVTDGSADQIADAVAALVADPERRRAMGRAGRTWALLHLDPERTIGRYEEMYAGAAAATPIPPG